VPQRFHQAGKIAFLSVCNQLVIQEDLKDLTQVLQKRSKIEVVLLHLSYCIRMAHKTRLSMTCYYFGLTKNSPVIHISRTLHLHITTYLSSYTKKERKKSFFAGVDTKFEFVTHIILNQKIWLLCFYVNAHSRSMWTYTIRLHTNLWFQEKGLTKGLIWQYKLPNCMKVWSHDYWESKTDIRKWLNALRSNFQRSICLKVIEYEFSFEQQLTNITFWFRASRKWNRKFMINTICNFLPKTHRKQPKTCSKEI